MPHDSDPVKFFKDKKFPFPSFYADRDTAQWYETHSYEPGKGKVFEFKTKRDVKLLLFTDENNIKKLAEAFLKSKCVASFISRKKNQQQAARRELLFATGFKNICDETNKCYGCLSQEGFVKEFLKKRPSRKNDEYFKSEKCKTIEQMNQHRLSIDLIDDQISRNLCCVMKELNIDMDGYIADKTNTAWGTMSPNFHEEIMVCFTPDVF